MMIISRWDNKKRDNKKCEKKKRKEKMSVVIECYMKNKTVL
jgi:hypothetical protein